jgi:hypothetical protein
MACGEHSPASKIYSQACAVRTTTQMTSDGSGEIQEHDGGVRLRMKHLEVDKSGFFKTISKNFKRGIASLEMHGEGGKQTVRGG